MIPNTKENREQYLKRATDRVKVKFSWCDDYSIALPSKNVNWEDKEIQGFVLLPDEEDSYKVGQTIITEDGTAYLVNSVSYATPPSDNINHPPHYQSDSGIECIDAIKAALTSEEFRGYCKGNAMKYLWRERLKGGDESLQKANWYINKELEEDK